MKANSEGRRAPNGWAARAIGAVFGVVLATILLLPGGAPASSSEPPAATVTVHSKRTGMLQVTPHGTVLTADLRPGSAVASAALVLDNRAGRSLDVRLRAEPSNGELDQLVRMRVTRNGAQIFHGPLSEFRRGSLPVRLGSQARQELIVEAWLPADAQTGYEYRSVNVDLQYVTTFRTA